MPKITVKSRTILIESIEWSKVLIVFVADKYCQGQYDDQVTFSMQCSVTGGLVCERRRAPC